MKQFVAVLVAAVFAAMSFAAVAQDKKMDKTDKMEKKSDKKMDKMDKMEKKDGKKKAAKKDGKKKSSDKMDKMDKK